MLVRFRIRQILLQLEPPPQNEQGGWIGSSLVRVSSSFDLFHGFKSIADPGNWSRLSVLSVALGLKTLCMHDLRVSPDV